MDLQQQIKMGAFISKRQGMEFQWGVNDCNTFFIEMHDYVYGTDDFETRVKEKYNDKRSAIQFMKDLGLTPGQWLALRDYTKLTSQNPQYRNGDVAIVTHKQNLYACVWVYYEGAFWGVPEGEEIQGYKPSMMRRIIDR
jgi:hypothetical protein